VPLKKIIQISAVLHLMHSPGDSICCGACRWAPVEADTVDWFEWWMLGHPDTPDCQLQPAVLPVQH